MRIVPRRPGVFIDDSPVSRAVDDLPVEGALALSVAAVRQRTLDLSMPGEDGFVAAEEVLALLKRLKPAYRGMPVRKRGRTLVLLTTRGSNPR